MHRRSFVRALGLGVLASPALLRRAFADAAIQSGDGLATMVARARAGRPLFVIVVPEEEDERDARASAWTELIYDEDATRLAPLDGHAVVCATQAALARAGVTLPARPLVFVRIAGATVDTLAAPARNLGGKIAALGKPSASIGGQVARALRAGIPGSVWVYQIGCGDSKPEDARQTDEVHVIGCGMGGVPSKSRRFLRFFAASSPPARRR